MSKYMYNFRGNDILVYDSETKQMEAPLLNDGSDITAFNFCRFIPEDYELIGTFFYRAFLHAAGDLNEAQLINVAVV